MKGKLFLILAFFYAGFVAADVRAQEAAGGDAPAPAPAPATAKPAITRINLHLKSAMPQDVFDELAKQGGIKFTTNGSNIWDQNNMQTENDIDMTDRPFWSAVNEACGLWNLTPQQNNWGNGNNAKKVMLTYFGFGPGQRGKMPVVESDGFLIQAQSFNHQQSINYAMPQQSQNFCSLQLMVFVDPAIHIVTFNQSPKVDEAVDDAGNSMVPDKANNVFYGGQSQRSMIYQCNVPLKYPDNPGKKIAHLKFTLSMRGSDKLDSMTVDKPLDADETTKEFGDTTITFHSLKKAANGMYECKLGISKDDDQGGANMWGLLQNAQLLDAKGRSFTYAGGGGGGGGGQDGMVEYTVNYQSNAMGNEEAPSGAPAKWELELPTKSHAIKIPVEFSDLQLP